VSRPNKPPVRVAVDIGGTFTDLHLHDAATNQSCVWKTPSTPDDPSIGLLEGLREITRVAGLQLGDIDMILHGSTIATNAVLERKLPKGALLTTKGFRDVLEIGRHMRRDVYTLKAEPRPLLIPRQNRYGLTERIKADGSVLTALDENEVRQVAAELVADKVQTVAVVFLHGYRNPVHEHRVQEILKEVAPGITVATSFDSSPEIREFERTSTTVLNAMLQPVISNYLERVDDRLSEAGVNAVLYLVQSNGGLATPEDAAGQPARLLLSGPAGGATAMAHLAQRHALDNLVGLDVGGTSSDISVLAGGEIGETQESSIDGLPVRLPMVDIRTIGAGGGSIARVQTESLRVGPESAGAKPGPVCYARGGEQVTVTDANALLGYIDASAFKTGGITLDVAKAGSVLESTLCKPLSLDKPQAALGVLEVANSHMADAIRLSLFENGADPGDFALAPFGGAAGLHACAVAEELGMHRIVFPSHASTLSALGILEAELRHDLSVSELMLAEPASIPGLVAAVSQLHQQGHERLEHNGLPDAKRHLQFTCDMRYRGQAFELTTPWNEITDSNGVNEDALTALINTFHRIHQERFAFTAVDDPIEIVAVRCKATGRLGESDSSAATGTADSALEGVTSSGSDASSDSAVRSVFWQGHEQELPCESRERFLAGGDRKSGPMIIEEEYTVLLIADGWQAEPLAGGDILCERIL